MLHDFEKLNVTWRHYAHSTVLINCWCVATSSRPPSPKSTWNNLLSCEFSSRHWSPEQTEQRKRLVFSDSMTVLDLITVIRKETDDKRFSASVLVLCCPPSLNPSFPQGSPPQSSLPALRDCIHPSASNYYSFTSPT